MLWPWHTRDKEDVEDVERRLSEIADRLEHATLELQNTVREIQEAEGGAGRLHGVG